MTDFKIGDKVHAVGHTKIGRVIGVGDDWEFPIEVEFVGRDCNITEVFKEDALLPVPRQTLGVVVREVLVGLFLGLLFFFLFFASCSRDDDYYQKSFPAGQTSLFAY